MRFIPAGILALGLMVIGGASAQAQQGMRGSGGYIGGFNLLTMPQAQQELGFDERQATQARAIADRMATRYQQDMGKLKGLNSDERMKRTVTLADAHYEEGMRQIRTFMKPEQVDRFDQILLQLRGPMAMLEPKTVQALSIKNEQAQQIAGLVAKAQNDQKAAAQAAGNDRKTGMIKVEAIAAQANEAAVSILSPEQQRTWQRLSGKPFRPDLGGGDQPAGGPAPK